MNNITSTRRKGPFQSIPKSAHKPSASMSSTASSTTSWTCASHSTRGSQDIVARILAQDEIPRGTFSASEAQKKNQSKPFPERLDSRRALLSVFNGSKAPIVFKGPSFGVARDVNSNVIIPTGSTTAYLHKELPPTPRLGNASSTSPAGHHPIPMPRPVHEGPSGTLPPVRPLNLNFKRSQAEHAIPTATTTLASKRLSRAVRAAPAPIRPPPRLRGIAALNGPSSANTSDEEGVGRGIETEALKAGTTRVPGKEDVLAKDTPIGDLPINPLDIPVDWDGLHECWTSPVALHPEEEGEGDEPKKKRRGFGLDVNDELALETFQKEVAGLFATTPNESIGESGEHMYVDSATGSPSSDGSVTREKRHGRMLVTKQLKLCLDASVQFDKHPRSERPSSGPQYKAGESFLMMTSPLTPCNANMGLRTSSLLDAYSYVS